jgi:hypothetical protein
MCIIQELNVSLMKMNRQMRMNQEARLGRKRVEDKEKVLMARYHHESLKVR